MFRYFGRKAANAHRYPRPADGARIVEPFAGSCGFSLRLLETGWTGTVLASELNQEVYETWHWLMNMTPEEITRLPMPAPNTDVHTLFDKAPMAEGYVNAGRPRKQSSQFEKRWCEQRKAAARLRPFADCVEYSHGSYENVEIRQGDYVFVDPPYQQIAKAYAFGSEAIDYVYLSKWCQELAEGGTTVVICEQQGATWLPWFRPSLRDEEHRTELQARGCLRLAS